MKVRSRLAVVALAAATTLAACQPLVRPVPFPVPNVQPPTTAVERPAPSSG